MKVKVISLPIFSRFCMFCALLGQDFRYQVSVIGPLVYLILFILAGNDDMHESLEEFEIWPDLTTDCRVSCT